MRHLPVAVRLLRLETAVRDLNNALALKAPAGEQGVAVLVCGCAAGK